MQKRNGKRILLKTFMKLSVQETETIIKILTRPAYCPITKASNNSHFHSSHFLRFIFPANISDFFSLCYLFSSWKLKTIAFSVTIPQGQHQVSSAQQSLALFCGIPTWMGDQKRIPNKQPDPLFKFFSILLTFGRLKQ